MSSASGPVNRLWLRWKSLKLPWRKQWLIGKDLAGNTFWEFKETANATRFRRIVKYSKQVHYADVKLSPAWVQWLRHTRPHAPSLQEQRMDEMRQENIKRLAAAADERWASAPSFLDRPEATAPEPAQLPNDSIPSLDNIEADGNNTAKENNRTAQQVQETVTAMRTGSGPVKEQRKPEKQSPWAESDATKERQPDSWRPKSAKRA